MANQTISAVTRNFDDAAISGLVNSDGITVNNGGTLIMDADTTYTKD